MSKIEAGKIAFAWDDCNLHNIVNESINLIDYQAQEKRIHINLQSQEADLAIRADCKRIKQVVLNLLSNAIKFSPEDSEIRIKLRSASHYCFVTIIDSGPGISRAKQKWIFEQFNQIHDDDHKAAEGTGLGLAISKRIITAHSGVLTVKNCHRGGSEFTIGLKRTLDFTPHPQKGD
jgi:signal transduction histidine kinase